MKTYYGMKLHVKLSWDSSHHMWSQTVYFIGVCWLMWVDSRTQAIDRIVQRLR